MFNLGLYVKGTQFGDNANNSNAVLRNANVNNSPAQSNSNNGSSLKYVLVNFRDNVFLLEPYRNMRPHQHGEK